MSPTGPQLRRGAIGQGLAGAALAPPRGQPWPGPFAPAVDPAISVQPVPWRPTFASQRCWPWIRMLARIHLVARWIQPLCRHTQRLAADPTCRPQIQRARTHFAGSFCARTLRNRSFLGHRRHQIRKLAVDPSVLGLDLSLLVIYFLLESRILR